MNKNIRKGKGYSWEMSEKTGFGTRLSRGFTIDNLDSKTLQEAENRYEEIFIIIREALAENGSLCMDSWEDRLSCAQALSDTLKVKGYLR